MRRNGIPVFNALLKCIEFENQDQKGNEIQNFYKNLLKNIVEKKHLLPNLFHYLGDCRIMIEANPTVNVAERRRGRGQ